MIDENIIFIQQQILLKEMLNYIYLRLVKSVFLIIILIFSHKN